MSTPGNWSPAAARALTPGTLVQGRYQVQRVLGQGGMGAVYLVRDARLAGRLCAMKELLDYSRTEQERVTAVRRFLAEAETLAALSDPGIPQVYDRFIEQGRYYLVMEFVAGADLGHVARYFGGPLPELAVVRWALQVCDVLTYLHQFTPPVVHRDLKPANLLLVKGGRVKLVDFGIARAAGGGRGTSLGTQGYAPPEQYRGEPEPRSDLYALGASLHHLLSGRDPQQQAPFDFPPLTDLVPGIRPELAALVAALLSMQPQGRPASAEAVAGALLELYPGLDPYHARGAEPRLDDLVGRLLDARLGSGSLTSPPTGATSPLPQPATGTAPLAPPAGGTSPLPQPAAGTAPLQAPAGGTSPLPQPAAGTAPLAPPAGATSPLPQPAAGTAPLAPPAGAAAPAAGTVPLTPPQPEGRCPICTGPIHAGQKFCTTCGVRVSGPLPRLQMRGVSTDLALRVPPGYWQKGPVELVTCVDDAGRSSSGVLIRVLPGARAEYAFVARTQPDRPVPPGTPVEVYLRETRGDQPLLTAIGPDAPDRIAEAVRLWQRWLTS